MYKEGRIRSRRISNGEFYSIRYCSGRLSKGNFIVGDIMTGNFAVAAGDLVTGNSAVGELVRENCDRCSTGVQGHRLVIIRSYLQTGILE